MKLSFCNSLQAVGLTFALALTSCSVSNQPSAPKIDYRCSKEIVQCLRTDPSPLRWVSGHRGGLHTMMTDNTVGALARSASMGLRLFEVDLRRTIDGKLVLFHDKHFSAQNMLSPKEFIGSMLEKLSLSDIKRIVLIGSSEKIPSINEAVSAVEPFGGVLQVDVKGVDPEKTVEALIHSLPENVVRENILLQCSSVKLAKFVRAKYPNVAILPRAFTEKDVVEVLQIKPEAIQIDLSLAQSEKIRERIHSAGSKILVKTLDDVGDTEESWNKASMLGIDIILTDHPFEAGSLLKRYH